MCSLNLFLYRMYNIMLVPYFMCCLIVREKFRTSSRWMLGSENVKILLHNITLVDSYLSKMELGMLPSRCLRLRFVLSFFYLFVGWIRCWMLFFFWINLGWIKYFKRFISLDDFAFAYLNFGLWFSSVNLCGLFLGLGDWFKKVNWGSVVFLTLKLRIIGWKFFSMFRVDQGSFKRVQSWT
jgi:hypothetical protein